jgi:SAM-dependent methyltransferase
MSDFHLRTTCRLCDGPLTLGLSLTPTPLANELVIPSEGVHSDVFPLDVMVCDKCAHVQLSAVVSPERLFRQYPYRSGASAQFVRHLKDYAGDIVERFRPRRLIEIGSSDGTFLEFCMQKGVVCIGFEPAKNVAAIAQEKSIPTIAEFFDPTLVGGDADVVIANHVFAHADDLRGIALGVKELLSEDGIFVFEVGYLPDTLVRGQFDVIYGEHTSYHHLHPLVSFFRKLEMHLFDAEHVETQGGAIRCFVSKKHVPQTDALLLLREQEQAQGMEHSQIVAAKLHGLGERIANLKIQLRALLFDAKAKGARVAAYGAPAKAVTFCHQLGIGSDLIDFIVDDSPLKQGKYLPGKNIPILAPAELLSRAPDYCVIFGWNFAGQILRNNASFKGKWIVPLPELKIL